MKQDRIVIMLHQISPQIPNSTQINEHVCLHGMADFAINVVLLYIFNLFYLLSNESN